MKKQSQSFFSNQIKEAEKLVQVGSFWTHYKSPDDKYKILAIGFIEAEEKVCVVYQPQYGDKIIWVRTLENFLEKVKREDGEEVGKFQNTE